MPTSTWSVTGMTCDHCARAVTQEVTKLDGVTDVAVDVPGGRVTVTSNAPLPAAAVRDAVDEAGYDLVDA
jgi:copper chaperone CopZ